jgi:enoyl-CoA hydratase
MENDPLLVKKAGSVCTLIINRPQKRNSLSPDLLIRLCCALEELAKADDIHAIVLRGTGDQAFSSGYDIGAIPTEIPPERRDELVTRNPLENAIDAVLNYPYPIIAMINGSAFGAGCELAVCCDLRIAADDIVMGMTPAKLGVVYSASGLLRFVHNLGLPATRELFYTGRHFDAQRLRELGLVDYAVPRDQLEPFTYKLAEEIASNAPLSIKGTKRILGMFLRSFKLSESDFEEAQTIAARALNSQDLIEGRRAFKEKRKPIWKGR